MKESLLFPGSASEQMITIFKELDLPLNLPALKTPLVGVQLLQQRPAPQLGPLQCLLHIP